MDIKNMSIESIEGYLRNKKKQSIRDNFLTILTVSSGGVINIKGIRFNTKHYSDGSKVENFFRALEEGDKIGIQFIE